MGNCPRRNVEPVHNVDDDEWLIIAHNPIAHTLKFKKAVTKIIKLLKLRKIWSKAGSWLNTSSAREARNTRIRTVMSHIFATWPQHVLKNSKAIFGHLKRNRGILVYR